MFRDFGAEACDPSTGETGPLGTTSFGYDVAGRKTSITYPSTTALTINYAYLVTGELDTIKQSTTTLADYGHDNLGNRTSAAFGNGAAQAFTYDPVSRLASLTNALTDTNDLNATFAYNPASQIVSNVRTGDMYAWTGHGNGSTAYVSNGLNQQTSIGGAAATWDSKGNLTSEPQSAKTYGYSSENLLTSATGGVTLAYDPALRLYQTVSGPTTTRFLYDGLNAIAEYNGSNALQRRFVFDPTTGQPVLWYEGTGTAATNRRYLSHDERGSVISVSGSTGASLGLNTYDEYRKPGLANLGRYQYTGQKWIGEAGLYDYKFRDYLPHLGIFAQTDPIGQVDSPNLYAYVLNDPVNLIDPLGLEGWCGGVWATVCGKRLPLQNGMQPGPASTGGSSDPGAGRGDTTDGEEKIPQCELKWLAKKLGSVGLPTSDLSKVTFHMGLPLSQANAFSAAAYSLGSTNAVTQSNMVFIKPSQFGAFTTSGNAGRYEEIFHTRQFAALGQGAFYDLYALGSLSAAVTGSDTYKGNPLERTAKQAADALANMYARERPCG